MENILNKVVAIEDYNGDTIMAFEIDDKGNIKQYQNCSVADLDGDYLLNTDKMLIRIQADE